MKKAIKKIGKTGLKKSVTEPAPIPQELGPDELQEVTGGVLSTYTSAPRILSPTKLASKVTKI